jgi:hypothetical protein
MLPYFPIPTPGSRGTRLTQQRVGPSMAQTRDVWRRSNSLHAPPVVSRRTSKELVSPIVNSTSSAANDGFGMSPVHQSGQPTEWAWGANPLGCRRYRSACLDLLLARRNPVCQLPVLSRRPGTS